MKDIDSILTGVMGVFAPVYGSDLAPVDEGSLSPGYLQLVDTRGQVNLVVDSPAMLMQDNAQPRPDVVFGYTENGSVLLFQVEVGPSKASWGGGQISTSSYKFGALVADGRLGDLDSTLVTAIGITFPGFAAAEWAGLSAVDQNYKTNPDGRLEEMTIRLHTGERLSDTYGEREHIRLTADWNARNIKTTGLDIRLGLAVRLTSDDPVAITELISSAHMIQDLLSIAFGGYVRASHMRAAFAWTDDHDHDADMWQSSLMPDMEHAPVRLGDTKSLPLFTLIDIGGLDSIRRWMQLYETHPRAIAPLTNAVRRPALAPDVHLLHLAAAIEYWVSSHKGSSWRTKGVSCPAQLALHVGSDFDTWVGDSTKWATEFLKHVNLLKHDPKFDPDPDAVAFLAWSGHLLLLCALLNHVAGSNHPTKAVLKHHTNVGIGSWLTSRYRADAASHEDTEPS